MPPPPCTPQPSAWWRQKFGPPSNFYGSGHLPRKTAPHTSRSSAEDSSPSLWWVSDVSIAFASETPGTPPPSTGGLGHSEGHGGQPPALLFLIVHRRAAHQVLVVQHHGALPRRRARAIAPHCVGPSPRAAPTGQQWSHARRAGGQPPRLCPQFVRYLFRPEGPGLIARRWQKQEVDGRKVKNAQFRAAESAAEKKKCLHKRKAWRKLLISCSVINPDVFWGNSFTSLPNVSCEYMVFTTEEQDAAYYFRERSLHSISSPSPSEDMQLQA